MARIRFSYDNLIERDGVILTGGTIDAAYPLSNLAEYHPSARTRLTDMTDSFVRAQFNPPEPYDLVAVLDHNASPHRNLLQYSGEVGDNPTEWVKTNSTIAQINVTTPELDGQVERFICANAGSLTRYVQNTRTLEGYTTDRASAVAQTFTAEVSLKQQAAGRHARLIVLGTSGDARAVVNLNDGTLTSSAATGNFSDISATVTPIGTFHKVVSTFTVAAAETSLEFRIQALDSDFNTAFDSTSGWFFFSSPALIRAGSSERYDLTLAGASGGLWKVKSNETAAIIPTSVGPDADSSWLHMAQSANPKPLSDALGTLSCYAVVTRRSSEFLLIELHDPDNVATEIDIGALWAGRSWQPALDLQPGWQLVADQDTGMLNLSGTLESLTAAEYYGEVVPMGLNARVGAQVIQIAAGGQEFRSDSKPILCIIDSDETEYGQQQMVYGFIDRWDKQQISADQFRLEFSVRGIRA